MTEKFSRARRDPEEGLGLVEIVVSMFLIGLLAIAFLPLVIQSLNLTGSNQTLATATQLANTRVDLARAQVATSGKCGDLTSLAAQAIAPVIDERGKSLQAAMTVSCPTVYPGTASVVVTVASGSTVVSRAKTLIFVKVA